MLNEKISGRDGYRWNVTVNCRTGSGLSLIVVRGALKGMCDIRPPSEGAAGNPNASVPDSNGLSPSVIVKS